jgi:hypothetical protein
VPAEDGAEVGRIDGTCFQKLSDANMIFWTSNLERDRHQMFGPQYSRLDRIAHPDSDHVVERVI